MDQSVPPNQVKPGSFPLLSGVDGRFNGGLRHYFGNKKVLDLDGVSGMGDIDTYDGPSFFKYVTFQKKDTATIYRGFVVRWDSQNDNANEQVDLIYTLDGGSNWLRLAIWAAGNGITSSLDMDCVTTEGFLLVAVDTKATKTIYWNGAALAAVDTGPGAFSETLAANTLNTSAVDTSYNLRGDGTFRVAYRFYDSTRGIYSALSDPLTVRLSHFKTTKATGTISLSAEGGDSGLLIDGDIITINGRTYEADNDSSVSSDVTIPITGLTTIAQMTAAITDAINGDSSAIVTAYDQTTSVLIEYDTRGTGGNTITISVTEYGANTDDISVSGTTLTGGGAATAYPEEQCKAVLDFPANDAVIVGQDYDDIAAAFDTVDIFRSINISNTTPEVGSIYYLEQSIPKAGNWASSGAWDALTVSIGTILDEALPFLTIFDPEKDIVKSPPQSGSIGRYENQTYMGEVATNNGGYDTVFSSAEHASSEYFSTYNVRKGTPDEGRPLRFIQAGDSLFQLHYNAVSHIFKSGKLRPIQIKKLHSRRGITGKEAAHSSGNSIFMISGLGLVVLNGSDGAMGTITSVDRLLFDTWKSDLAGIKSCYDARMNASFFLNPDDEQMLALWHGTRNCNLLDGANFVGATSGPDIANGRNDRAFFITATGLIVSPDVEETGSGTMWDLDSSYTVNGSATSGGATLTHDSATFHADMVGCKVYMTSGDNAGEARTVSAVNVGSGILTFSSSFDNDIAVGDTYAVSPIPFSLRGWALQVEGVSRFTRWNVYGISVKSRKHAGFTNNVNNTWRTGAYRNSGDSISSKTARPDVDTNPSNSAESLPLDGIDVEPYVELISSGVKFELTDLELSVSLTDSRKTTSS
jgi:hypothetical protein